jgi:hypothetical protein
MKTNQITRNRSSTSQFAKRSQEIGNKRCERKCRCNVCVSSDSAHQAKVEATHIKKERRAQ